MGEGEGRLGLYILYNQTKKTFQETNYIAVVIKTRFELFAPFLAFETL